LASFGPKTDEIGNVWVTAGSGSPQRLIVAPVDEPGYVVSEITEDGYLRVGAAIATAAIVTTIEGREVVIPNATIFTSRAAVGHSGVRKQGR
jgi:putative aminopeptidase FrvX